MNGRKGVIGSRNEIYGSFGLGGSALQQGRRLLDVIRGITSYIADSSKGFAAIPLKSIGYHDSKMRVPRSSLIADFGDNGAGRQTSRGEGLILTVSELPTSRGWWTQRAPHAVQALRGAACNSDEWTASGGGVMVELVEKDLRWRRR